MLQTTAIIVFARTAEAEANEKHLFWPNSKVNKNVLQVLRQHTLSVVKQTKLPYYIFSEDEQVGETFAVKITNAYSQVFAKGYTNVIGIGADVPSITSNDLLAATSLLNNNKIVCGPTQCGGSYLLGINKAVFNPDTFLKLAWQTDTLFEDVTEKFAGTYIMKELQELNDASHLLQLSNTVDRLYGVAVQLLKLIKSILQNTKGFRNSTYSIPAYSSLQLLARAP